MAESGSAPVTTLSMRTPGSPGAAAGGPPGQPLPSRGPAVSKRDYNTLSPIYRPIANRLWERHRIRLFDHVDRMLPDGDTLGEGISFVPLDSRRLKAALLDTGGFHWDDRRVFLYRVAASETIGEGYREYGVPSLHFQLADGFCNLHLDRYGFVFRTPSGDVFTPDMFQHIVDELWWPKIIDAIRQKSRFAGELFGRLHPVLPSSERGYRPAVGASAELLRRSGRGESRTATVTLEFHQDVHLSPCNPASCGLRGPVDLGERQYQLTVRGTF